MFMPNFDQIWWTRSKCRAEMRVMGSNLVDFGPLTPGGHLGFWDKWEIRAQACLKGQVVCPCKILSKSDEREPNAEPKCDFCGQIWSILGLWPPAAILDFVLTDKFLRKLVCRVKKYVHANFFSKSDERDTYAKLKCDFWGQIWSILDLWPPAAILDFAINDKFLCRLVLRVK